MRTKILMLLAALMLPLIVTAQENWTPQMAYANANSVNIRKQPDNTAKKVGSLSIYTVVELTENQPTNPDWKKCRFYNDNGEMVEGYVSAPYLTIITDDPITKAQLDGKQFNLLDSTSSDLMGWVTFSFKGNEFEGNYSIISKEMSAAGGSGTVDFGDFEGVLNANGVLAVYDNDTPVRYDAQKKILLLLGYLWSIK